MSLKNKNKYKAYAMFLIFFSGLFLGNKPTLAQESSSEPDESCDVINTQPWYQHVSSNETPRENTFSLLPETQSVIVKSHWSWSGDLQQFQTNETHNVNVPFGTTSCSDFGNEELDEQWSYCGEISSNWTSEELSVEVEFTGDDSSSGSHISLVEVVECSNIINNPTPTPTSPPSNVNGASNSNSGESSPESCGSQTPDSTNLISAIKTSGTTAEISWSSVTPVTHYTVSYGTSSEDYQFGIPNTGNTTNFTVGGLDPRLTYYFVVYAVNDCAPSPASNEVSTGRGGVLGASTATNGQVLGTSTSVLADAGKDYTLLRFLAAFLTSVSIFTLGKRYFLSNG